MTRKRVAILTSVVLCAVVAFVLSALPSSAQDPPEPIAVEFLTGRAVFTDKVHLRVKVKHQGEKRLVVKDKDPSTTVVARFTVQPGAQFPWHTHRGPVVVNVVSGALTYVGAEDCIERVYPAGTAFFDLGHGHVHTAFNATDEVTVIVATFFSAPAEGPLLIPAEPGCSE
jgi:quercetin dioxygenase-like cupin family protein